MKKIMLFATVMLMMSSCDYKLDEAQKNEHTAKVKHIVETAKYDVDEIEYDGHTYLVYDGYESGNMIHSASCKCHKGE